jgi:hypothetical protein
MSPKEKTMKTNRTISMTRKLITAFAGDQSGAVAAYVAILMAVLIGFVGMAVDMGRFYTTHSQASAAADAAAMAAATQLNGQSGAIARARLAAENAVGDALLVNNDHDFAEGDATIQIVQLRFLKSLPASDDDPLTDFTTKDSDAGYVEATTESLTTLNTFLVAVGVASANSVATAVAGNQRVQCKIPPLMICNPWEGLDPTTYTTAYLNSQLRGVTLLTKTYEGGVDNWAAGNAGLLDPPPTCLDDPPTGETCENWDTSTNTGAKAVTLALARVPTDYCYTDQPLSPRTGQAASMRSAVNVWFDIYENPHMGGGAYIGEDDFRPAQNVTKGYITTLVDGQCVWTPANDPTVAMGLPPDDCFAGGVDFSDPVPCTTNVLPLVTDAGAETRIGNGDWSQGYVQYMRTNHGADPIDPLGTPTDGLQAFVDPTSTRYEVYLAEIANGLIPKPPAAGGVSGGEDGKPMCSTAATSNDPDRRKLTIAVINCVEQDVKGNSTPNVDAAFFLDMFVLRPIRDQGTDKGNIWLEFIEISPPPGTNGAYDIVQLYR